MRKHLSINSLTVVWGAIAQRRSAWWRWLMPPLFMIVLVACNASLPLSRVHMPTIIGGRDLPPDHAARKSSIALLFDGQFRCSGVLVATQLVVTAAHCLQNQDAQHFTVIFGDNVDAPIAWRRPVLAWQSYRRWGPKSGARFDVAWLRLAQPAPAGFAPAPILPDPRFLRAGEVLTQVGYGRRSEGSDAVGQRLMIETVLVRYEDSALWRHIFVTGSGPGRGTCHGDSGGPSYVYHKGQWQVAGILFGAPPELFPEARCADGQDVQTFIGVYAAWIEASAQVTLPRGDAMVRASVTIPEHADSFVSWCQAAPRLADDPWYTVAAMMSLVEETDCERAATKLEARRRLDFSGMALADMRPIASVSGLEQLRLPHGSLREIASVEHMPALRWLDIHDNQVVDLSPLRYHPSLQRFVASRNQLQDVTPLQTVTSLTHLNLACNRIQDLNPLASLSQLAIVQVENNRISSINALLAMPRLAFLFVAGNPLSLSPERLAQLWREQGLFVSTRPSLTPRCEEISQAWGDDSDSVEARR